MNNCRKFRDLILTDYADGELSGSLREELEKHLSSCKGCFKFCEKVRKDLISPIRNAGQEPLPACLWESVKEKITQEALSQGKLSDFLARLKEYFFSPRLVPAIASFAAMIFIASFLLYGYQVRKNMEAEQGEYLLNVFDLSAPSADAQNGGVGSLVEEYFL